MKKCFLLFAVALISVVSCKHKEDSSDIKRVQLVSPKEMKQLIQMSRVQLIDVRTPEEYESGHMINANNLNFFDEAFEKELDQLDKDIPVCVYCKSGGRSAKASEILRKKGFKTVYDLNGGIISWEKEGMPVEKSKSE